MANVVPFFRSPFTDLTGSLINHQFYGKCEEMEMRMMNCFEAYGVDRGRTKCKDLHDDLQECFSHRKQKLRVKAMRAERERQFRAGERSKEEHYAKTPTLDAY